MPAVRIVKDPEIIAVVTKAIETDILTPVRIHTLIYSKLLNYFNDDLDEAWGGQAMPYPNPMTPRQGLKAFLSDVEAGALPWVDKMDPSLPWGPENFKSVAEPPPELGAPYEYYISCGAGILTLKRAEPFLGQPPHEVALIKETVLLDSLVIAECIDRLLTSRPTLDGKIRFIRPDKRRRKSRLKKNDESS